MACSRERAAWFECRCERLMGGAIRNKQPNCAVSVRMGCRAAACLTVTD